VRILIVEDNPVIAANLYDYLEGQGYSVEAESDGQRAYQLACRQLFDAILLDLGLPRMDGIDLCRKLREEANVDTPILVLTARDTLEDKVKGFGVGADDYLVKPFALEEVDIRLQALHRRRNAKPFNGVLQHGQLVYDSKKVEIRYGETIVELPPKCMRLLGFMMSKSGKLFTRAELEIELWGEEQETSERLRHHLHLLRRALVNASGKDPIVTVRGMGYRLEVQD
jgi:DNA-binding response OmpR family regulator